MPRGTKLADAYVQIIPSAEGISNKLREALGDLPAEGDRAGRSIGERLKNALIATGITATIGKILKESFGEGAALEQSLGGVETLFKNHADKVKKNAEDAYRTAGVSANEYMENVTSFSASLISSLGGDTEKAADVAHIAMVDMSDNANKFGTDMQSIQYAYQGFAKQNYTMLDNLKLGYGGTKEEMQRLLNDAEKFSGVKYDISNLSDVYNAIHTIQKQLDIAGTTSKEASTTFSGSFGSMKASAKNFLGVLSAGGDIDKAFNDLKISSKIFGDNFIRMTGNIGNQIKSLTWDKFIGENETLKTTIETVTIAALTFIGAYKLSGIIEKLELMNIKHDIAIAKEFLKAKAVEATNFQLSAQTVLALKAAGAIGAAVVAGKGIAYLITDVIDPLKVNETTDSFEYLSASTVDIQKNTEKLTSSISKLHEEISKENSEGKTQADNLKLLKDRMFELNKQEILSTSEKAEMKSIVEQLNTDYPKLGLALDNQSGKLKNNTELVGKMADAYGTLAASGEVNAAKLQTARKNLETAENEYKTAVEKRNEAIKNGIDQNSDEMLVLNQSVLQLHGANETAQNDFDNLKKAMDDTNTANQSLSAGFGDTSQYLANLSDSTVNNIKGICDSYAQAYQQEHDLVFGQMNLLDEFCGKSDITKEQLQQNLQSNIDGFNEWETNLSLLKEKVNQKIISEDFYKDLAEMGPKGAGYAKAFATMSDAELKEYEKNGKQIFKDMNEHVDESMEKIKQSSAKALDELINLPNEKVSDIDVAYKMLGNFSSQGYIRGIEESAGDVNSAITKMVEDGIRQAKKDLHISSPSKVFAEIGMYTSMGFANGIENNSDLAVNSARDMVRNAIAGASKVNDDITFRAVGQAVSGSTKYTVVNDTNTSLKFAFLEALAEYFSTGSAPKQPLVVNNYVGSKKVSEVVIDDINNQTRRNGSSPIISRR